MICSATLMRSRCASKGSPARKLTSGVINACAVAGLSITSRTTGVRH